MVPNRDHWKVRVPYAEQIRPSALRQYELRFQWGLVPLTSTDAGLCRMQGGPARVVCFSPTHYTTLVH